MLGKGREVPSCRTGHCRGSGRGTEDTAGCGNHLSPAPARQGRVELLRELRVRGHTQGERYLLWKDQQLLSKILIVAARLKYLLQVENRDVSMKSLMIKPRPVPQWPGSTSSGSLDALSPEEHEK